MRLDIIIKTEHTDISTAVTWSPDCQLFSCSDDKSISKWSSEAEHVGKISLANNVYATSISWLPSGGNKQGTEMFALSCTDGTFRFISRSGREEKKVAAHEGFNLFFYSPAVCTLLICLPLHHYRYHKSYFRRCYTSPMVPRRISSSECWRRWGY